MNFLPYNPYLKKFSKEFRRESTFAEVLLWMQLRKGQIGGYIFNRQKPIGNFIADFYCKKLNLVIEVDGISHEEIAVLRRDKEKEYYFNRLGLFILRFTDEKIKENMSNVVYKIKKYIELYEQNPPTPLKGGIAAHLPLGPTKHIVNPPFKGVGGFKLKDKINNEYTAKIASA